MDSNSNAIFELADIDLHNRILISSQNSDLQIGLQYWEAKTLEAT